MKQRIFGAVAIAFAVGIASPTLAGLEYTGKTVTLGELPGRNIDEVKDRVTRLLTGQLGRTPTEAEIDARANTSYLYWDEVVVKNGAGWPWNHCQSVVTEQGLDKLAEPKSGIGCVTESYVQTGVNFKGDLEKGLSGFLPARLSDEPEKVIETVEAFDSGAAEAIRLQLEEAEKVRPVTSGELKVLISGISDATNEAFTAAATSRDEAISNALAGVVTIDAFNKTTGELYDEDGNRLFATTAEFEGLASELDGLKATGEFLGIPLKWLAVGAAIAAALAFIVGLFAFLRSRKARTDALVANQKADSTAAMVGELEEALSEKADVSVVTALTSRVEAVEQAVTDQRERIAHLEGLVISRDADGRFVGLNQEEVDLMTDGESLPLPVYGFDDEDEDILVRVDMVMHRPLDGPAYVTFDGLKSGKHKLDTTKVVPIFRYLLKAEEMRWVDGTTPYDEAATVVPATPLDPFAEADDDASKVFGTNVPSADAMNRLRAAVAANRGQPTPADDSDPDGGRVAIPSFLRMRGMAEARNDD